MATLASATSHSASHVHHPPIDATAEAAFVREARMLLRDQFQRHAGLYWADLLITLTLGYGAASFYMEWGFGLPKVAALLVAAFALFRAGTFIHEISHMGRGVMPGFRTFWDICCGVPMLMPAFLYDCHIDHHSIPHYGTEKDGEYITLGKGPVSKIFWYLSQVLILPLAVVVRFQILAPISFLHPKLRQWVLERCSSYTMHPFYRREIPQNAPRAWWAMLDVLCCLRITAMLSTVLVFGLFPWTRLVDIYVLAICVIGLNWTRNLVAHHYGNEDGPMSHVGQLTDSINITGKPYISELLFPLGLRYHALHHFFPGIPYHSLGKAHHILMAKLPANSPYHATIRPSFVAALRELWTEANTHAAQRRNEQQPSDHAAAA